MPEWEGVFPEGGAARTLRISDEAMVYFFHRAGQYYRVESHVIYELEITTPHGVTEVERFTSAEALAERERALHDQLRGAGWDGPHGRTT